MPKNLKIVELQKQSDFVTFKEELLKDFTGQDNHSLSNLVIPKVKYAHELNVKNDKKLHPFLTWSSVTSAAPSPPAENLSTINKVKTFAV